MNDDLAPSGYTRIILASHWDGLIGPSSHSSETVAWECWKCAALVAPAYDSTEAHDEWHRSLSKRLSTGELGARRTRLIGKKR